MTTAESLQESLLLVLKRPFSKEGRCGWMASLPPELHDLTDNNEHPYQSRLRLLENGRELGPAHSAHETIRTKGSGCYSFWNGVVYFSTRNGEDPNTNDYEYAVIDVPQKSIDFVVPVPIVNEWTKPAKQLRGVLVGAGNRGAGLGELATSFAGVEINWVVDISMERAREVAAKLGENVKVTDNISDALTDPAVDFVIVASPDHLHRDHAVPAFLAGKHVFLEKPVATTAQDAEAIINAWQQSGKVLQLGYVLRQAPFYMAVREVVKQGLLGPVRIASLSEQLNVQHGASFMRRWHSQSNRSGGLLVHKCCHDLDIICWLFDSQPRFVSSFGGSDTFNREPPARFCSKCGERNICPYADNALHERRSAAEIANPTLYGLDRCVFGKDKDIVDNQVVSFELENGVRGNFYLAVQGPARSERRVTLIGDLGRLNGIFEDGTFSILFTDKQKSPITWSRTEVGAGHGGGDRIAVLGFLDACTGRTEAPVKGRDDALRGLIFALDAERARVERAAIQCDLTF